MCIFHPVSKEDGEEYTDMNLPKLEKRACWWKEAAHRPYYNKSET